MDDTQDNIKDCVQPFEPYFAIILSLCLSAIPQAYHINKLKHCDDRFFHCERTPGTIETSMDFSATKQFDGEINSRATRLLAGIRARHN